MATVLERFDAITAALAGMLTGAAVGVVGSVFHRFMSDGFPAGVVAALAAVALGVVFMRALAGRGAYSAYAVTLLGAIALAWLSPDPIVLDQPAGIAWAVGATTLVVVGFLLPEALFE